jgi:hypothetical protein
MKMLLVKKRVFLLTALLLSIVKIPVSLAQTEFSIQLEKNETLGHSIAVAVLTETLNNRPEDDALSLETYEKLVKGFRSFTAASHMLPADDQYIAALRRLFQKHDFHNN